MMMPANFSAIAESEMTYVVGGGLVDVLAPVMTTAQWKQFNTNIVTLIGNAYSKSYIHNTLDVLFSGTYVPGDMIKGYAAHLSSLANPSMDPDFGVGPVSVVGALNVVLDLVGNAAAIYNLGFGKVSPATKDLAFTAGQH